MDCSNIIKELQTMFPVDINKTGPNKGTLKRNVIPVAINYRPIARYIEGKKCYAYLDLNAPDINIGYLYSKRSKSGLSSFYDVKETLDDLMSNYDSPVYLSQFQRVVINTLDIGAFTGNTVKIGNMIENGAAINIVTEDFAEMERLAFTEVKSDVYINGVRLAPTMSLKTSRNVTVTEAMRVWYNSYMVQANIELTALYWTNIPRSVNLPYIHRFNILNEFVPFIMKFEKVYNPLFQVEGLWKSIGDRYPLLASLEVAYCRRESFKADTPYNEQVTIESTRVYYILRGNLQKFFDISLDPADTENGDNYDITFYSSILLNTIQQAFPETFMVLEGAVDWYVLSKVHNDVRYLIQVTCTSDKTLNSVGYETFQIFKALDPAQRLTSYQRALCFAYAVSIGMDPFNAQDKYDYVTNSVITHLTAIRLATFNEVI